MKVLAIIGIVLAGLSVFSWADPESMAGMGVLTGLYLLAFSIVALVRNKK
jgi:hypothetical protein